MEVFRHQTSQVSLENIQEEVLDTFFSLRLMSRVNPCYQHLCDKPVVGVVQQQVPVVFLQPNSIKDPHLANSKVREAIF